MTAPFAVNSVHEALCRHLQTRPDLGPVKAVLDCALESQNPVDEKAPRAPQRWFVLFLVLALLGAGCFLYFYNQP